MSPNGAEVDSRRLRVKQENSLAARKGLNTLISDEPTTTITALQRPVCRAIKADILQFKVTFFI